MDGERILIVDDDESNRQLLSLILKLDRYRLDEAAGGREALLKVKEEPYDLVLLDLMMPLLDGYQVLKVIRSEERFKNMPVIVISAVGKLESVAHCIKLGANDYLLKPFDQLDVRNRVRNCLDLREGRELGKKLEAQQEGELERWESLNRNLLPAFLPFIFEPDPAELSAGVLETALLRFRAEAGSLFRLEPTGSLRFIAVRNKILGTAFGGTTGSPYPITPLRPLEQPEASITREDQAVLTAFATGQPVAVDILELRSQKLPFTFNFHKEASPFTPYYMLASPLKDPSGKVIGVLELINPHHPEDERLIPFDPPLQQMVLACCQVAAVAFVIQAGRTG